LGKYQREVNKLWKKIVEKICFPFEGLLSFSPKLKMSSHLAELILSSTGASSALPTTSLHSVQTGSLLFSFKSPHAATATSTQSTAADKDAPTLQHRKTLGVVESSNGQGGFLIGLGGKEGRAGINLWGFQKVSSKGGQGTSS
jgi:hypothetical protein